jgi:hypothetical protein
MRNGTATQPREQKSETVEQSEPIECRTCWNLVEAAGMQCRSCKEENGCGSGEEG